MIHVNNTLRGKVTQAAYDLHLDDFGNQGNSRYCHPVLAFHTTNYPDPETVTWAESGFSNTSNSTARNIYHLSAVEWQSSSQTPMLIYFEEADITAMRAVDTVNGKITFDLSAYTGQYIYRYTSVGLNVNWFSFTLYMDYGQPTNSQNPTPSQDYDGHYASMTVIGSITDLNGTGDLRILTTEARPGFVDLNAQVTFDIPNKVVA